MTTLRVTTLVAAFAGIALAVVYLRTEQARSAARALAHESAWIELRRELWQTQAAVARLRAPEQIHGRMGWMMTDLSPPGRGLLPGGARQLAAQQP